MKVVRGRGWQFPGPLAASPDEPEESPIQDPTAGGDNRHLIPTDSRAAVLRRARAAAERDRRRRRKLVGGALLVDPDVVARALRSAMLAGIGPAKVTATAGFSHDTVDRLMNGRSRSVLRSSAERILESLEKLLDARQHELDDLRVHLEQLVGQLGGHQDHRLWSADPLRETVRRRSLSVAGALGDTERRYFYRCSTLTTERADRMCFAFGLMPEEVWGDDWIGLDATAGADNTVGEGGQATVTHRRRAPQIR